MGQGKPEALAHGLAVVWGRLHAVVVAAMLSQFLCACVCVHVHVWKSRGERGGKSGEREWLALERGGGGLGDGESSSSWKTESLEKRGSERDIG